MRGLMLHVGPREIRRPRPVLPAALALACATALALPLGGCKDQAKESAAHAAPDAAVLADLVAKDVGEIERGLPQGAVKLAPLVAGGADPRQDIAGVRRALVRVRREVIDLNVGKSTFFALTDPSGVAIRNDLEEDVMAGQNIVALFPALTKATDGFTTGTGAFANTSASSAPDKDWIAGAPVKRPDGSTGALLVTGWSYRYFARHLQEALKTHLLEEAKAAGQEGKIPVFYTAVFDRAGVYAAPLTPEVDAKALADQNLAARTESGPATGTLTIADRAFGFAAQRTPSLAADTGIVVLRSDDM
jgi:hypothetical protein